MGSNEIRDAVNQGKISIDKGIELTNTLNLQAATEQSLDDGEYIRVINKITGSMWNQVSELLAASLSSGASLPGMFGAMARMAPNTAAQRDDKEYQKIFEEITRSKGQPAHPGQDGGAFLLHEEFGPSRPPRGGIRDIHGSRPD
jgi:hypothetical protein